MKTIITFFILILSQTLFSQVWLNRYNGSGNQGDYGTAIAVDNLGNAVMTGYAWGINSSQDYVTIKYNPSGVQQWVAIYNGPADTSDYAESVCIDNSGNIYVTGWSYAVGTAFDYATIKYDPNGVQQWVSRYDGPGHDNDVAETILLDSAGNIYVNGYSVGLGTSIDFATVKYNNQGVQQWVARYNDPASNQFDVAIYMVMKNGFLYVTGYSKKLSTGYDFLTIKYNSATGDTVWTATYNDPTNGDDFASRVGVDNSGNIYVTGYGRITSNDDYVTIKYNSSGVQQWVSTYDGPATVNNSDRTFGLVLDDSSNVYITGYSGGNGTGQDWATIKYNTNGVQQWVSRVAASGIYADVPYDMKIDASNNVYVTGNSAISGQSFDYFTVKYNSSNGDSIWTERYNGPGNSTDIAQAMALDSAGDVFVTGYSRNSSAYGSEDIVTIKYSQLIGIRKISSDVPVSFMLSQNYPNPFNPSTKIKFSIPLTRGVPAGQGVSVTLKIYDLLGREVALLVNQQLKPGTYEIGFDASNYPSGVYFYRLTTGNYSDTKKMVLLK